MMFSGGPLFAGRFVFVPTRRARPGAGVGFRVALGHARVSRVSARARGRGGQLRRRARVLVALALAAVTLAQAVWFRARSALGRARGVERGGAAAREARSGRSRSRRRCARRSRNLREVVADLDVAARATREAAATDALRRSRPDADGSSRGPPPPGVAADRAAPVARARDAAIHSLDPRRRRRARARAPTAPTPRIPRRRSRPALDADRTLRASSLRRATRETLCGAAATGPPRSSIAPTRCSRRWRGASAGGTPRTGRLVSGGLAS